MIADRQTHKLTHRDRHTDTLITVLRAALRGGGVITHLRCFCTGLVTIVHDYFL